MMEMAVDVCLPNMLLPPCFVKQDLFTVIQNNKYFNAHHIYFSPKEYTPDTSQGRKNLCGMICSGLPMMVLMLLTFGRVNVITCRA
jgi:hypothetical protein